MSSTTDLNTPSPVLDALDCLNRSRQILEYVIDMRTRTRDDEPGLGWILAEIQAGIVDALAVLGKAKPLK